MKKIEAFEQAIATRTAPDAIGANTTLFWAYFNSQRSGNDLVDFSEVIWDEDVEAIAATFHDNGITEFTISSRFSSLISTLAAFDKLGFKLAGVTEVNANYKDIFTNDWARVPAVRLMSV